MSENVFNPARFVASCAIDLSEGSRDGSVGDDVVKGKLSPTKLGTATEDGIEKGWLLVFAEEETAALNAIPAAIDVTDEADDTGVGGGELRSSDNEFA